MKSFDRSDCSEEAVEAFAGFLERLEAGHSISELVEEVPHLARHIRELHGDYLAFARIKSDVAPKPISDEEPGPTLPLSKLSLFNEGLKKRIEDLRDPAARLKVEQEIGAGGFGQVFLARDLLLRRVHARKVLTKPQALHRFLEEAQVTAQLSHPGVVPVHDMGIDSEGRPYFSMDYVNGRTLDEVFALVEREQQGWTTARALDTLLRVCDTVAYAHDRGVVHRDLKPANVMVGRYGDVFVMDWGLARVDGYTDQTELPVPAKGDAEVRSDRKAGGTPSEILTVDGQAVGTPCYMSPEQARGDVDAVGPTTDVYAVGAMLYQLFAGHAPYLDLDPSTPVLVRVFREAPTPIGDLAPRLAPELEAICEKAMAREPRDRYPDLGELAADLRAYLENRVVRAFEDGPWAQARKWVRRNRGLSTSIGATLLVILLSGIAFSLSQIERRREEFLGADLYRISFLTEEIDKLWPPHPEILPTLEACLAASEELVGRIDVHRERLDAALESAPQEASEEASEEGEQASNLFDSTVTGTLTKQEIVDRLIAFADPEIGMLDGVSEEHGLGVRERIALARHLRDGFSDGGEYAQRWEAARSSIAERYDGLELAPQMGLVPLGVDPQSGLWEFWHVISGDEPTLEGHRVSDETGMVFVLIPGGTYEVGGQSEDDSLPYFDQLATEVEGPIITVELPPYFISKFESTQGQWKRIAGTNPSGLPAGEYFGGVDSEGNQQVQTLAHPVDRISYNLATRVLGRSGLRLPSEAEWEVAARAGTTDAFWTGRTDDTLHGAANVPDATGKQYLPGTWDYVEWDDGWVATSPVGTYAANGFGLFDVAGNVYEWTVPGELPTPSGDAVLRGGSWQNPARNCRIAYRWIAATDFIRKETGVRPSRSIE